MNRLPPVCCVGVRERAPHSLVSVPRAGSGAPAWRARTLVWLLALTFRTVIQHSLGVTKRPPSWEPFWAEVHTLPGGLGLTVSRGMRPGLSPQSLKGAGSWWCSGLRAVLEALFWGRCCK